MADELLAILPLVSRVHDAQRLADRVCPPIDRLRGVSVRLAARREDSDGNLPPHQK